MVGGAIIRPEGNQRERKEERWTKERIGFERQKVRARI